MSKDSRFEIEHREDGALKKGLKMVLVDKETGVHYLFVQIGHAGGLTPLLDAEGHPVIKKIEGENHHGNDCDYH